MNELTIPGVYAIKVGDKMTISDMFEMIPNPDRRWWQFWKAKHVRSARLQRFTVIATPVIAQSLGSAAAR